MTGHSDFEELVAGYALGTLDERERRSFEAHLPTCPQCQEQLTGFDRVALALAHSTQERPPSSLRARTLTHATGHDVASPTIVAQPSRPRRSAMPWLAAAAAVVLATGFGLYAVSLRSEVVMLRELAADASNRVNELRAQLASARRETARLASTALVLGAPDLVRVDLRGQGPSGRAFLSGQGLLLSVRELPALPSGQVYQLWVIPSGSAPVSAGVFSTSTQILVPVPRTDRPIATVAITVEPGPAGSPGPTSAPLLAGSVGS